jgi:hypothetical protein
MYMGYLLFFVHLQKAQSGSKRQTGCSGLFILLFNSQALGNLYMHSNV